MNTNKLFSLFLVILVIVVQKATADVPVQIIQETPKSAYAKTPQDVHALSTASVVAERLRRMWPGNDVGILTRTNDIVANNEEDVHDLVTRLGSKYSVYKKLEEYNKPTPAVKKITDYLDVDADGNTSIESDYKSVFNNANQREFDPKYDNPDNLESMLSSLWGKRYGHMNMEQREKNSVNENVLIIRATSKKTAGLSQGISSDGSVDKFIARPVIKKKKKSKKADAKKPFKPTSYWYGPSVYGSAIDVTGEQVSANSTRAPAKPPKPPVDSYVFPEYEGAKPGETPVTIIQTITVTRPKDTNPIAPTTSFTPIMTNDLNGPTEKPHVI